jgi:glycerophosphoryl diester phosphodiesterase
LVQALERALCRRIGVYPETKHPTHFDRLGLSMEEPLVAALEAHGYRGARARVFIQSFEVQNLRDLRRLTRLPLVQLLSPEGSPADVVAAGGKLTYADMATAQGLRAIGEYAVGVGPERRFLIPERVDRAAAPAGPTSFVADAHRAGLVVHPYTFRAENRFLAEAHRSPGGVNALGDLEAELADYLALGIDGFFTDHPDIGRRAVR